MLEENKLTQAKFLRGVVKCKDCIPYSHISLSWASSNLCIAKARHKRIVCAVGSSALAIATGFIHIGEVAEYKQRGFMQSLHLTAPRRNLACVSLFSSDLASARSPIATSPTTRLVTRLRFCNEGWCLSDKGFRVTKIGTL